MNIHKNFLPSILNSSRKIHISSLLFLTDVHFKFWVDSPQPTIAVRVMYITLLLHVYKSQGKGWYIYIYIGVSSFPRVCHIICTPEPRIITTAQTVTFACNFIIKQLLISICCCEIFGPIRFHAITCFFFTHFRLG